MSIGHPIPEIWLFQNLTSKIQGQGHGWGECWKSQSGCNILSIHIAFVPCQSALPFLRYSIFKIWPWKSKVKVMGEVDIGSHKVDVTSYLLTRVPTPFGWWNSWTFPGLFQDLILFFKDPPGLKQQLTRINILSQVSLLLHKQGKQWFNGTYQEILMNNISEICVNNIQVSH